MYVRSKFWTYSISGSVVLYWLQQKFSFVACHSRREYEYHWLVHFVGFLRIAFAMHDDSAWIEILPMLHVVVMHSGSEALWLCYRKWCLTVKFEIVRLNCSGIQESLRACANLEAKGSRGLRLPGLPWKPEGGRGGGKKKKEEEKKNNNLELAGQFFFFLPPPPPPSPAPSPPSLVH